MSSTLVAVVFAIVAALSLLMAWQARQSAPPETRRFLDSQSLIFWGIMFGIMAAIAFGLN